MRIVFFGTSTFAVPALQQLGASAHQLVGVITQPDRPAGRGRHLAPPPIAAHAHAEGLPLFQPTSLSDPATLKTLRALAPECIVVVAYGKFLPQTILALPPKRCINIHPSLLPKYRGAAPINWAVLNGDAITGVTILYMSDAMDAGDILQQQEVPIHPDESAVQLSDRLAPIGATLVLQTLDQIAANQATPRPQDARNVVLAPLLTKTDGLIDWRRPARLLLQQIRGMQPWPNAYTFHAGTQLTIFRAEIAPTPVTSAPGTVEKITRALHVATGDGQLCLTEVQLAGKRRMSSEAFLRGHSLTPGIVLANA